MLNHIQETVDTTEQAVEAVAVGDIGAQVEWLRFHTLNE